jgi:hypothetical protein
MRAIQPLRTPFIAVFLLALLITQDCTAADAPADRSPPPASRPLRILFAGDTDFGESYARARASRVNHEGLAAEGPEHSLKGVRKLLDRADFAVVNLETVLTTATRSALGESKRYIHYSDPERSSRLLAEVSVDAVSLANNHALDFGPPGLTSTVAALEAVGLQPVGAGADAATAAKPLLQNLSVRGGAPLELAVAAGFEYRIRYEHDYAFYATDTSPGTNAWSAQAARSQLRDLRRLRPRAWIVAFPHFGGNYRWRTDDQAELARALIEGGADLVLGHGAHMAQELELYQGRWIVYSLGNFVFNSPGRYKKMQAGGAHPYSWVAMLDVYADGARHSMHLRLYPLVSDNLITGYQPRFLGAEEADSFFSLIEARSRPHAPTGHFVYGDDDVGPYLQLPLDERPANAGH